MSIVLPADRSEMKTTSIRFPDEVYESIQREASVLGASINSYLMTLIHLGRIAMGYEGMSGNEDQDQANQGQSSIHLLKLPNAIISQDLDLGIERAPISGCDEFQLIENIRWQP